MGSRHVFPVDQLRPSGGEIYAVLFENTRSGVPLGVYWSLRIDFAPVVHAGEMFDCNLMANWVRIAVRDWRDLAPHRLRGGPEVIEASFYTVEHDLAVESELDISARRGTEFRVNWTSVINYPGWAPDEADPRLPVRAEHWLPFTGIIVSDELVPETGWEERARGLLAPFVDLRAFGPFLKAKNQFGIELRRLLPE